MKAKEPNMQFGAQSEIGAIESLLLKHPADAFQNQDYINQNWQVLNYLGCPDYSRTVREFEAFVQILTSAVDDIYYLPPHRQTGLDSVYTHDPVLITNKGAVLGNMGKTTRRAEPAVIGEYLADLGIPIFGSIAGNGRLEGGDVLWLNERSLAVGLTCRSNTQGVLQLRALMHGVVDEIIEVPLPYWNGPDECLHLMSIISPVDLNLAVVYSRLLPVFLRELLIGRGIRLIEVPDTEFENMGCNVLALAPRKCIMLAGNPVTKHRLEAENVEVFELDAPNLCRMGAGGPTCLTRPILRRRLSV